MANQLKDDFREMCKNLRSQIRSANIAIATELQARIVKRTPIDTGRAKSSWRLNPGAADPSVHPEIPETAKLTAEQAEANAFMQRRKINRTKNPVIVISNNLDYIVPLEQGHSKQAPSGMVALTLEEFRSNPKSFIDGAFTPGQTLFDF